MTVRYNLYQQRADILSLSLKVSNKIFTVIQTLIFIFQVYYLLAFEIYNLKTYKSMIRTKKSLQKSSKHLKNISMTCTEATISLSKSNETLTTNNSPLVKQAKSATLGDLVKRYENLEDKYTSILQKTKERTNIYEKQKQQVQKLKKLHEKDTKQIARLRSLLGFMPKKDAEIQVNIEDKLRQSNFSTVLKSTSSSRLNSKQKWYSPQRIANETNLTSSKVTSNLYLKKVNKDSSNNIRKISKSPYSKYKFIPSVLIK